MQRVFVVGCPRSGTTLVQAMLARHPDVFSLPETYFFPVLLGDLRLRWKDRQARPTRRWYHRAGLAQSWGRRRLQQLEQVHAPTSRYHRHAPRKWRACVRRYVEMLDTAAMHQGCRWWVEKTPEHLLYLDEIAECVPDAHFVHVLRRGIDVVASVIDADLRVDVASFRGGAAQWGRRWNRAMELHMAQIGNRHHHLLCLEDLVDDTQGEWARLQGFLGLDPGKALDDNPQRGVADIEVQPWMATAITGVVRPMGGKAEELFGPRLRAWLRGHLDEYRPIREAVRKTTHPETRSARILDAMVRLDKAVRG